MRSPEMFGCQSPFRSLFLRGPEDLRRVLLPEAGADRGFRVLWPLWSSARLVSSVGSGGSGKARVATAISSDAGASPEAVASGDVSSSARAPFVSWPRLLAAGGARGAEPITGKIRRIP